jgi:hypothetical protein
MASSAPQPWKPYLGYSTNVHRAHDLAAVRRFLRDFTIPIKERVFGKEPAGLELHLGIGSTRELEAERARRELAELLEDAGLVLFSINAYPLLDFHARRVKEKVYQPSWAEPARAHWTSAIARVFAGLLHEEVPGSISTLGGEFRRRTHGGATFQSLAWNYLEVIESLIDIQETIGRTIVLAVEPEPETTFETAADVIDFFQDHLLPLARERWRTRCSRERIEADLRRFFTVNVDTCHLSVLFEDQVESLRKLEAAGLRLGKMHVTNAVALRDPYRARGGYEDLRGMDEPRYFHQFCGRDDEGAIVWRGLDLDELPARLERGQHPPVVELRSHFHVPLYLKRYRRLGTTQEETAAAVREVVRRRSTRHLVLETYTWPILMGRRAGATPAERRERLIAGIAREFRWLLQVLRPAAAPAKARSTR